MVSYSPRGAKNCAPLPGAYEAPRTASLGGGKSGQPCRVGVSTYLDLRGSYREPGTDAQ